MKSGLYEDLPIETYHGGPGVSRSTLMALEDGTAKDLHHRMTVGVSETPAMALGSAVDCLVFEPHLFGDNFAVKPGFGRSKADQAAKAEWEDANAGKSLLTEAAYAEAQALADAVKNAKSVRGLMADAKAQASLYWDHDGQLCKARPDGVDFGRGTTFDLKTTHALDDRALATKIVDYGYDVQAAMNAMAMDALGMPWKAHVIVWVRKSDPIDVRSTVFERGDDWMLYGEARFLRLVKRFREALKAQTWEGWDTGVGKLPMPKWVSMKLAEEEELERAQQREGGFTA